MFNFSLFQKIKKRIFPFYKKREIRFIFKKLQEDSLNVSKTAMFVGGCVRKHLSDEEIDDIDIATTLTSEQIKEKFKDTHFNVIESGIKHGTITLVSEKLKFEVTTLRKDIKTDGRHAEIEYTNNWQEDSNRRDFTINAIYLDINGKIFDPQLGTYDLKNKNVKFIGDPNKRIEEDYLRIIRFIRFSLEYQSKVEKSTIDAIKVNLDGIKKISKERVLIELLKILKIKNFEKIINNNELKKIFLLIFPEFRNLDRLIRLQKITDKKKYDLSFILSILLVDETNNYEYFYHKYNVSNEIKNNLNLFVKNYLRLKENKKFFEKDLKKNLFYFGKKHLKNLNLLNFLDSKKIKIENYLKINQDIDDISLPVFPIDGEYLKKRGIKEGIVVGKILKQLKDEWLKNDFNISKKRISLIIDKINN